MLSGGKLEIDKSFVLKCLVVAHGEGAELSPEKFSSVGGGELLQRIEAQWQPAEAAFQQLRDFIENELRLFSPKVIRSYGSFIPLFDYLFQHQKPDAANRALMHAYYYKAQLFNWFARGTDSTLNTLHGVISKATGDAFPLAEITGSFSSRHSVHLTTNHLSESRLRLILLNLLYVEKFGTSPFNVRFKGNEPHADHIFPQSPLRTKLGLSSNEINDIGNFRLIGASDNLRKHAELPADYFTRLKSAGVPVENHLLLPEFASDPSLLNFAADTYRDFRERRRAEIFRILKRVIDPGVEPTCTAT
jgi:hypothetical protein